MRGELNKQQVENLLLSQVVGRIACCSKGRPYIVPVTYVYDGEHIYGQMQEGKKLELLRKNKHICFETDIMTDMANWKSVVITGMFEELSDEKAEKARELLSNSIFYLMTHAMVHGHEHEVTAEVNDENRIKPVLYRIKIEEKSGRFERR